MDPAQVLPHVTASLNALAFVLLVAGLSLVRSGRRAQHRVAMLSAVAVSGLFLVAYLAYHVSAPIFVFRGQGWIRPAYYALLISHVVLAAVVGPMIAATLWRAAKGRFDGHRRLARWTLPVWMYVSASGVAVYVLLYHVTA